MNPLVRAFVSYLAALLFIVSVGSTNKIFGQEIQYEQLADLPTYTINDMYYSPEGEFYVLNRYINFSRDNGQSWSSFDVIPDGFFVSEMEFLDNGYQLIKNYYSPGDGSQNTGSSNILFKDGKWDWINSTSSDQFFYASSAVVEGNDIYYYTEDSIYVRDVAGIKKRNAYAIAENLIPGSIEVSKNEVLLFLSDTQTSESDSTEIMVFSLDLQYIETRYMPDGKNDILFGWDLFEHDDKILYSHWAKQEIYFSDDNGQNFIGREIVGNNNFAIGIYEDYMYYFNEGEVYRIKLDDDFSTSEEEVLFEIEEAHVSRLKVLNGSIVLFVPDRFYKYDLESGSLDLYKDLKIEDSLLRNIQVNQEGHYYAMDIYASGIFKSIDHGQSWEKVPGNIFFTLNDEGGYQSITAHADPMQRQIIKVDRHGNIEEFWNDNAVAELSSKDNALSFKGGKYRMISIDRSCFAPWEVLLSVDFGPFEKIELPANTCFDHGESIVFSENEVFIHDHNNRRLFIEYSFDNKIEARVDSFRSNFTLFTAAVNEDREVFVYPAPGVAADSTFMITYYASDVDGELVPAGRGPAGYLMDSEKWRGQMIVSREGNHFFRDNVGENFRQMDHSKLPENFIQGAIVDKEGHILITSDYKLYRSSKLQTISNNKEVFEKSKLSVFPNPVQDLLFVDYPDRAHFDLLDVNGQLISRGVLNGEIYSLDLSDLQAGIYLLRVVTSEGLSRVEKIVKN